MQGSLERDTEFLKPRKCFQCVTAMSPVYGCSGALTAELRWGLLERMLPLRV